MKDKIKTSNSVMKTPAAKRLPATLVFLLTVTLFSCVKENNAAVLVRASGNGTRIGQATVYLEKNTTINPGISLHEYDEAKTCDAIGEAYFNELKPGNYFFFATGYDPQDRKQVSGEARLTITENERHNRFEIVVQLK